MTTKTGFTVLTPRKRPLYERQASAVSRKLNGYTTWIYKNPRRDVIEVHCPKQGVVIEITKAGEVYGRAAANRKPTSHELMLCITRATATANDLARLEGVL